MNLENLNSKNINYAFYEKSFYISFIIFSPIIPLEKHCEIHNVAFIEMLSVSTDCACVRTCAMDNARNNNNILQFKHY